MGNSIGRGKRAKVMKIDGETFKLKTPTKARDVVKDYPGHVLLESEAVKHFGVRAKPLELDEELKPKKIYFLVELPKFPEDQKEPYNKTRRVRSGIQMSAKDRLEFLMLSKRSVSDISGVRSLDGALQLPNHGSDGPNSGPMQVKVRLPRSQVQKLLMDNSKDDVEVAEKIVDLCIANSGDSEGRDGNQRHVQWKPELSSIGENLKPRKKRVSFAEDDGEIQLAVDSHC